MIEKPSPPTLIICDSSRNNEIEIARCIHGILRTYFAHIGGETYRVHHVLASESLFPPSCAEKRLKEDVLIYYACADELSAAREKFSTFYTRYRRDGVPVIVVVKGLDDHQAAHHWVEKHITCDGAGCLFSTFAPTEDLEDDSVMRRAEQELQDLIKQSCLIQSERRGGWRK